MPLLVPSCSTETKQGKPLPFSYKERTEEPIILRVILSDIDCQNINHKPRSYHYDVLLRLEMKKLVKYVIATSNNNSRVVFQVWGKLAIEYARLNLVGYKEENDSRTNGVTSDRRTAAIRRQSSPSATAAALEKSCSTWKPLALASSA